MGGVTEDKIIDNCTDMSLFGKLYEEDEILEDRCGDENDVFVGCAHLQVAQAVEEEACMWDGVAYTLEAADEGEEVVVG